MKIKVGEQLLKVSDIAKMFQVTNYTVRTWIKEGKLSGLKINNQWRFPQDEVIRFANERYGSEQQANLDRHRDDRSKFTS